MHQSAGGVGSENEGRKIQHARPRHTFFGAIVSEFTSKKCGWQADGVMDCNCGESGLRASQGEHPRHVSIQAGRAPPAFRGSHLCFNATQHQHQTHRARRQRSEHPAASAAAVRGSDRGLQAVQCGGQHERRRGIDGGVGGGWPLCRHRLPPKSLRSIQHDHPCLFRNWCLRQALRRTA